MPELPEVETIKSDLEPLLTGATIKRIDFLWHKTLRGLTSTALAREVSGQRITGLSRRDDFYWTLASVFLDRREQFEIYDQAFHVFWRDPQLLQRAMAMLVGAEPPASQPGGEC